MCEAQGTRKRGSFKRLPPRGLRPRVLMFLLGVPPRLTGPFYIQSMPPEERFWPARLRWRLRGAMQWPAFVLFTLLDGVVIAALPPAVIEESNLIVGVLAATFGNLVLIGAVAPFLARRMAAREGAAPIERELLQDRIATVALAVGLLACLVSGLANRPVIVSETEATEEVGRELRAYVERSGNEELRRNLETANTIRLSEGYFRVCIARDDRRRYFCLFVDTEKDPTRVEARSQRRAQRRLRRAGPYARPMRRRRPRETSNTSTVLRPWRNEASGTFTAKLSRLVPRR